MQDSYGDGWNGASIDVYANGSVIANWGFNNGSIAFDSVETFNGDVIDFSFNSGSWDSEITFQITTPDGNVSSWGPAPLGVFLRRYFCSSLSTILQSMSLFRWI